MGDRHVIHVEARRVVVDHPHVINIPGPTPEARNTQRQIVSIPALILILLVISGAMAAAILRNHGNPTGPLLSGEDIAVPPHLSMRRPATAVPAQPSPPLPPVAMPPSRTPPPFTKTPCPLPATCRVLMGQYTKGIAPLTIRGPGKNTAVRFMDILTGTDVAWVFIRAGEVCTTTMPLGTFEVRWASGDQWYGKYDLFGPQTACSKAQDFFTFSIDRDGVSGYDVTLYHVPNGNLQDVPISTEEFLK